MVLDLFCYRYSLPSGLEISAQSANFERQTDCIIIPNWHGSFRFILLSTVFPLRIAFGFCYRMPRLTGRNPGHCTWYHNAT